MPVSAPPIPDAAVHFLNGRILSVGPWSDFKRTAADQVLDLGDAVILPGLVNAHCHLDYTDLAGQLAPPRAFPDWIKAILAAKASWSDDDFIRSWKKGAQQLLTHGTTTVANIETLTTHLGTLRASTPLRIHSFLELTGVRLRKDPAVLVQEALRTIGNLPPHPGAVGLSPHAPYSTVPALLEIASREARRNRLRITSHLAESREEFEMFMFKRGPMHDWLHSQRPDSDCGFGSPVQHAARHGLLGPDLLAAHVNYLWDDDARILGEQGVSVVHCPSSHAYFRHQRFPGEILAASGINLCLGTDSLASTRVQPTIPPVLSMFAEMAVLAAHDATIDSAEIIRRATLNGARALGVDHEVGALQEGFLADFCVLPLRVSDSELMDAIIHHRGTVASTWVGGLEVWSHPGLEAAPVR